jgi:hypothetical protein
MKTNLIEEITRTHEIMGLITEQGGITQGHNVISIELCDCDDSTVFQIQKACCANDPFGIHISPGGRFDFGGGSNPSYLFQCNGVPCTPADINKVFKIHVFVNWPGSSTILTGKLKGYGSAGSNGQTTSIPTSQLSNQWAGLMTPTSCPSQIWASAGCTVGCMDPNISSCSTNPNCNGYDPNATVDDGSCCIPGCTNPSASNHNPSANCDDGSCTGLGCTDQNALPCPNNPNCNGYDPNAISDDGSCCIPGCTDDMATNYNPNANCSDTSCTYPPPCPASSPYFSWPLSYSVHGSPITNSPPWPSVNIDLPNQGTYCEWCNDWTRSSVPGTFDPRAWPGVDESCCDECPPTSSYIEDTPFQSTPPQSKPEDMRVELTDCCQWCSDSGGIGTPPVGCEDIDCNSCTKD